MTNDAKQTFWRLLVDRKVEIPIFQRDYAQGRDDPRSKQIRRDFVDAIVAALSPVDGKPLDLGLVYGNRSTSKLELLDGQQRITTLFLFHWYLARCVHRHAWPDELSKRFQQFSYKTRTSAREFCRALATETFCLEETLTVSVQLRDASWFLWSWHMDPTINGAMVVLDYIQHATQAKNADELWRRLIESVPPRIHFKLLEPIGLGLTDSLYIKMNARGRPLTEFEQFKAWLEDHAEAMNFNFGGCQWKERLDKEWADMFWLTRGEESDEIDSSYLRFFRGMALNHYVANDGEKAQKERLIQMVLEDGFIPKEDLLTFFSESALANIFLTLDRLENGGIRQVEKIFDNGASSKGLLTPFIFKNTLFQTFVAGGGDLTYKVRVLFQALGNFLNYGPEEFDSRPFYRWMRVMRNLITNSPIDSSERFVRVTSTLSQVGRDAVSDIFQWLDTTQNNLTGFLENQVAEEKQKARLTLADPAWEPILAEAENHSYFQGQVDFLIEMSRDQDGHVNMQMFQGYYQIAKRIFADGGIIDQEECLVQRSLLVFGDYLPSVGVNHSFGNDPEQWREKIFRRKESRELLLKLFAALEDSSLIGGDEERMRRLIAERTNTDDWRELFIKHPVAIWDFRRGNIRFIDDDGRNILLLRTSRTMGYHAELRSFCFYHRMLNDQEIVPGWKPDYKWKKSRELPPYADLVDQGNEYQIEIRHLTDSDVAEPYEIKFGRKSRKPVPREILCECGAFTIDNVQEEDSFRPVYLARFQSEDTAFIGLKRILAAIPNEIKTNGELV